VTPADAFELLHEAASDDGEGLPPELRAVYGGDWRIPRGHPYVYVNFVVSRDGRVSFREPGHLGGGSVSAFDRRDQWLMALLRARADAVLIGDATVAAEPEHVWTAETVFPEEAATWAALRETEGRRAAPLVVILSADGEVPDESAMFRRDDLEVLVATPEPGADAVDLRALAARLADEHRVGTLLCEGGPRVYGSLLASRLAFDEFLTLSPLVLGEAPDGPPRPSLVEGVAFAPGETPVSRLLSVRRGGDYLYLRSRYGGA
jgi:riboflavin biosynthesis pyrimidine reductase